MSIPHAANLSKVLGNYRRLQILDWLADPVAHFPPQRDGDLVEDGVCLVLIAEKLGISQPSASRHMDILSSAGLVRAKPIGRWTFYRRDENGIAAVKNSIVAALDAPKDHDARADRYSIDLENLFGYLTTIDVPYLVETNEDGWFNQTLTQVDDSVLRLGIVEGEFHWHQHDDEDEMFFVLDGELEIDLADRDTVVLQRHQGFNVPKGVQHRTRASNRTVMLMISAAGVNPMGSQ